ncbi:alpha/beta hydrolase family protein [Dactylosporangium darangshiense]|uniref:Lipase n=1 Tax=Dactylosporangium darangshiense TaxID=579108 RepID=A0ABP8DRJ7_9ACTN
MRRRILLAALPAAAVSLTAAPALAAAPPLTRLTLPAPTGPEQIGTVSLHLVDATRPDPWVPAQRARELMVQIWYPACDARHYPRATWVSPALAAALAPPGSDYTLPVTHAHLGAPAAPGRRPVVLYSPGLGLERTASTAVVEELVSHGYVVVTIDHTHDSSLVEFPGGRTEPRSIPEPTDPANADAVIAEALRTRVADTRFVLDRLLFLVHGRNPDADGARLPHALSEVFDLSRTGMLGHSLGGAAAAEAMYEDRRIRAGANLDGTESGAVLDAGLDRPFLLFGAGTGDDDSWARLWSNLRGPRLHLQLLNAGHLSFTDYQVLFPQAGVPADQLVPNFGTVDPARSVTAQRAYLLAFFDRYLRGRQSRLLTGPSPRYPEIRFVAA